MTEKRRYQFVIVVSLLCIIIHGHSFAHSWMAPADEAKKINPIKSTTTSLANGQVLFGSKCLSCHGKGAEGISKETTGLSKDTPNLIRRLKNHTEGDFHWKIKNGKEDMPSFKKELSDNDIWDIVNYLKSLQE